MSKRLGPKSKEGYPIPIMVGSGLGILAIAVIILGPIIADELNDVPTAKSPDTVEHYPALAEQNLEIDEQGVIETVFGQIKWFNLTDAALNEQGLKAAVEFFEKFARSGFPLTVGYNDQGETTADSTITYELESTNKTLKLFYILPEHMFAPGVAYMPEPKASTMRLEDATLSAVSISFSTNPLDSVSKVLATEVCQATMNVKSNEAPPELVVLTQETVCNSLSMAFSVKQAGYSYEKYEQIASNLSLDVPEAFGYDTSLLILSAEAYGEIPVVGDLITVNK